MPYLIIICIAIIIVLLFNFWRALNSTDKREDAYMYIVDGSVQMKAWGTDSYFDLSADTLVREGDEISSSADAQVIIEFFYGTIMRMDGNTHVVFSSIENEDGDNKIFIDLLDGNLWFNQLYKSTDLTDLKIKLSNLLVDSNQASVFSVGVGDVGQSVRVFAVFDDSGLLVQIMNKDNDKVIEEEYLRVGQEIIFTAKVLEKYFAYQSPTVISALSDEFKKSTWYKWNFSEDESPTEFQKYLSSDNVGLKQVEPEVLEPDEGLIPVDEVLLSDPEDELSELEEDIEDEVEEEEILDLGPLVNPAITSVSGGSQIDENSFYNVTANPAVINGSVSGAAKVVVNNYTLTKFKPGDTTWTYYANADYALMQEGENSYEIYAIDGEGNKSEIITVKVRYSPPAPVIIEIEEDSEELNASDTSTDTNPE